MAKESDTDLLMRFILEGDQTVWAECSMRIDPDDPLMKDDFYASDDLHEYTNYFQIDDFSFDLTLGEDDANKASGGGAGGGSGAGGGAGGGGGGGTGGQGLLLSDGFLQGNRHYSGGNTRNQRPGTGSTAPSATPKKDAGAFASWRSAKDDDIKKMAKGFKPEFKTVSFSKVIDAASPTLFESCVNAKKFDKAIIVKRISQGAEGAQVYVRPLMGYLRLEFEKVLITSVGWTDGDLVTEKIQFEGQSLKMIYMPQGDDGTVDAKGKVEISYKRPQGEADG